MFDKIKDSIQKFSSKGVADEEAVEQLVKDIQRDLIKADVDVSLVSDLSDEIREEALKDDLPSGLTRKEHVLEIVYSKLEELLGEEAEIEVEPKNILLCGLYGAGKCVSPDSRIQLSDGRIMRAEELYEEFSDEQKIEKLEDGERFRVEDLKVPSFNPETLEMEEKPVKYLWKLDKDEDLVELTLENGNDHRVEVTPEHPFFTLEEGEVVKKRADQLNCSDYVAVPRKLGKIQGETEEDLKQFILKKVELDFHLKDQGFAERVKARMKENYGSLKNAYEALDPDIGYAWLTRLLSEKKEVPVSLANKLEIPLKVFPSTLVLKESNSHEIEIPEKEDKFLEFIGYLIADGYINEKYLEFNNADPELIERWQHLSKELFGLEASRRQSSKSENLEYSRISSRLLVEIICEMLETSPGAKSGSIKLPDEILRKDSGSFIPFLRAYFDCDGHAEENKRAVEITTKSSGMASQIRSLLLRNEIFSSRSVKQVGGESYYKIFLRGTSATRFSQKIGSRVKRKSERLEAYPDIQEYQGSGSNGMIPVGGELQKQRLKSQVSISEVQSKVNSYSRYEKKGLISRKSLQESLNVFESGSKQEKVLEVADNSTRKQIVENTDLNHPQFSGIVGGLKKEGLLEKKENGKYSVNSHPESDCDQLRRLACSEVNWVKVSKIRRTSGAEHVYDLTVEDNHSFVANHTIVHNTTTAGKLADFYRKRELKPALICADTDRPAAYDQLKQLAEEIGVDFYGEKDAEDPVEVVEKGMEKLDADVVIVDSAGRNSLNEDLQKELSDINDVFQPDEKILVMPADIGQSAREQAESFDEAVGLSGVIVTKMDSSAKGGGALVACKQSNASVQFIGTGEEVEDLEVYDPVDFVSEMLGQPDLESLLEKVEEMDVDPEEMLEGEFTLQDFKQQMESVTDTGMIEEMMQQLPFGTDQIPDNISDMTEGKIQKYSVIMDSMTDEEMADPSIINKSRSQRIAEGSGTSRGEVRELIKHYRQTKNMMDRFDKGSMKRGNMQDMLKKMGI